METIIHSWLNNKNDPSVMNCAQFMVTMDRKIFLDMQLQIEYFHIM
jgi:hypothetical protein